MSREDRRLLGYEVYRFGAAEFTDTPASPLKLVRILRHYLGTHSNAIAEEPTQESVQEVQWREASTQGEMGLVVDLNFRMDTCALYSDIILPAAGWYEKNDLNTTALAGMHDDVQQLEITW